MVKYDPRCRYAESHEWVLVDGDDALVGISDFAQAELNDIVYVELPEVGDAIEKGEEFGTVESVKAASEVYMPVSGEVVAVNDALEDSPDLVNKDPFGNGWLVRVHMMAPSELEDLLDADAYRAVCEKDD